MLGCASSLARGTGGAVGKKVYRVTPRLPCIYTQYCSSIQLKPPRRSLGHGRRSCRSQHTHKIQITSKTTKLFFLGCWTKVSPRLVHLPAVWRVLGNFSKHRLGKCSNRSPPPSNFLCPVSVNSSLVIPILWLGD